MHRAKLSRLSVFSLVFRFCSPCIQATLSRFSVFCCSPSTEQCCQDAVYFLLCFVVAVHAPKNAIKISAYFLLSFAVAVHVPSNTIKIQCIFCCLLQLQPMYRAMPSRFSVFSVVFCSCCPCTEQCRQDSVYFLLSFAVAAHVPSNAIKIQCIFCCLLQLQPMHPKITCQGIANARWFYHRFYPRYLPEVIIM